MGISLLVFLLVLTFLSRRYKKLFWLAPIGPMAAAVIGIIVVVVGKYNYLGGYSCWSDSVLATGKRCSCFLCCISGSSVQSHVHKHQMCNLCSRVGFPMSDCWLPRGAFKGIGCMVW